MASSQSVLVLSKSAVKKEATQDAFPGYEVTGKPVEAPAGTPARAEQPTVNNDEEGHQMAKMRVNEAFGTPVLRWTLLMFSYVLSIENAMRVEKHEDGTETWYDVCYVCLDGPKGPFFGHSLGVKTPREYVDEYKRRADPKLTVGKVIAEMTGAAHDNWVGTVPDSPYTDRKWQIVAAVKMAFEAYQAAAA